MTAHEETVLRDSTQRHRYVLELCHGVSRQVGLSLRIREPIKTDSGFANLQRKATFGRQF